MIRNQPTDIIWDLGYGDDCSITVLANKNGRFVVVDVIKDSGKVVAYYLEKLLKYINCNNHLPDDAFYKMLSGESIADVLKKNGFKVLD